VQLGEGAHQRQAQARALGALFDAAGLLVGTAQTLEVLRADADAGVGDDISSTPS
jgi:hypothetical protein